jgi:beta-lactamase regulating signal transducer with metallopeptidase domain
VYFRTRRVVVSISRNTIVPFSTRGLFKHHIVIPEDLVTNPRAFRIALGHEAQHIRQGDVNWEILLTLASPLFALNPAFWLLSDRIRRLREYTCDAAFLKKPGIDARDYCLLLVDFASKLSSDRLMRRNSANLVNVQLCGQEGLFSRGKKCVLEKRIIALSQGSVFVDKGFAKYVNLAPALLLVAIIGTGVLMAAKPADWSHDRLMLSTVANLERLNTINGFAVAPLR